MSGSKEQPGSREITENLTRQQLQELEEKEKTPLQRFLDLLITIFPLLCGGAAVWEYQCIPDHSPNANPMTYLVFLLILMGIYAVYWMVALLGLRVGNRARFQKVRYRAPLYSVLFLFLAVYDYLTLKTGILTQPFVPCLNSIMNIAWIDREMLMISTLYTLRLLFLGYFLLSLGMGNFGTFLGPMFFAFGLFAIGLALGRGSYAFLMRAMFDLPNGQILKNANGMSALRGGRGWLPIVVHGVGFLFGFSFFPYTLIVIALFGISLPQYLICYLLNDPIQKNIISPWERMQAQKET